MHTKKSQGEKEEPQVITAPLLSSRDPTGARTVFEAVDEKEVEDFTVTLNSQDTFDEKAVLTTYRKACGKVVDKTQVSSESMMVAIAVYLSVSSWAKKISTSMTFRMVQKGEKFEFQPWSALGCVSDTKDEGTLNFSRICRVMCGSVYRYLEQREEMSIKSAFWVKYGGGWANKSAHKYAFNGAEYLYLRQLRGHPILNNEEVHHMFAFKIYLAIRQSAASGGKTDKLAAIPLVKIAQLVQQAGVNQATIVSILSQNFVGDSGTSMEAVLKALGDKGRSSLLLLQNARD